MSNEPQQQKCLDYDLAREIQRDIEEMEGNWVSALVSLGERDPHAYRVEIHVSGVSGKNAAALHQIAEAHGVWLSIAPDPDRNRAECLRIVFDRPGQWYAEGHHHRLAREAS